MIFPGFSSNLSLTVVVLLREMSYATTESAQSTNVMLSPTYSVKTLKYPKLLVLSEIPESLSLKQYV